MDIKNDFPILKNRKIMKDSNFKHRESEEKFEKYKNEILNERSFTFRIKNLFSIEK